MTLINQLRTSCFFLHCPIFSVTTSCTPPSLHRHNQHTQTSVYKKTKLGTKEHMATTPYMTTTYTIPPQSVESRRAVMFSSSNLLCERRHPSPFGSVQAQNSLTPISHELWANWAKTRSHVSSWKFDHIWKSKRLNMGQF